MFDRALPRRAVRAAMVIAAAGSLVTSGVMPASAAESGGGPPKPTKGPCQYTPTPDEPAARKVPLPPDPRRTPTRPVSAVLKTNHGDIGLTLDPAKAPCTVQSFVHLIRHRFYDATSCHRLTAYDRLKVLQCGDPGFTGEGGPGYRYKDELPTDLPPWPGDSTGQRRTYARGVLAMANAGPDTNGSQFFLVYGDSGLAANYTVFGTVDAAGLAALDRIAAGGIQPVEGGPTPPVDGRPALPVDIGDARIGH
ncbi:peptidylprolyl isomerase [Streptosporangium pseudovulgare]|uniref:Peptidyl-prolyl cis-trans isomerase n=1 Tax=Streptosporangium pseudovulgare TaxID=35765 RepID=A0ABQ2QFH0_9ACTN|nr:peptidylprolyl isomerase [Streptosporangium pseudovulgare]GGP79325.1 peptidyl-prolyl cis-trans isomerase [Streptosporangium pseudovulgare]